MINVRIEVDGMAYEGHAALLGDGSLRLISRHGSRNVVTDQTPLPLEVQAEMALAEVVAQLQANSGTLEEAPSRALVDLPQNGTVEAASGQHDLDSKSGPRSWAWPGLSWAARR